MRSNPLLEEIEEGDEGDHLVRERDYGLNVGLVHDVVAGDWNREGKRGEQNGLSVLVLKYAGDGYDCRILESIISTWMRRMHVLVGQPDLEPFNELLQLSRALWKYGCSPHGFEPFANGARAIRWEEDYRVGIHLQTWAFIAVVFGWRNVFGRAVMEISELADVPAAAASTEPMVRPRTRSPVHKRR
jgi:hypothetical protein